MGYLLLAGIFAMCYFIIKEHFDKRSLIKTAKQFTLIAGANIDKSQIDLSSLQKNTSYYLISDTNDSFFSLSKDDVCIKISDLQYINLIRFQRLMDNHKNNRISDFEFFTNNKNRHLVFPFKKENGKFSIAIIEQSKMIADDFFRKKV